MIDSYAGRWHCAVCTVCTICGARRPEGHNNPNLTPQQKQKLLAVAKWTHEYHTDAVTKMREHSAMLCTSCVALKHSASKGTYFHWIKRQPSIRRMFTNALRQLTALSWMSDSRQFKLIYLYSHLPTMFKCREVCIMMNFHCAMGRQTNMRMLYWTDTYGTNWNFFTDQSIYYSLNNILLSILLHQLFFV